MHWKGKVLFRAEVNTAKNTDYIEKCFKQKLHRIKFPKKKTQWMHISIYPRSEDRELQRFAIFKYYNALK